MEFRRVLFRSGVAAFQLDGEVEALVEHARKRVRRVEADRREHRQELAEEKLADPLALRRVPLLAPRENDAFAGERRQHGVVEQLVLGGDERVRLAAHRLEHLRGGARVRTRLGKPELDAFLQPGDADLEDLVEVGGDDGDEPQPLERRHRVVGRHRQHAAVERENAELAVEKLRRKRCSAVHGEASILPVPCYRIRAMARHDTLAAVDLGSNSFHLQIGRVVDGQIYPLDAVREVLRLGAGLTAEKRIDRGMQAQALETLAKFAERLRGFSRQAVRAVGTNALRVAKNSPQFLREARQVLGFPIEVISGREEARLIYLGVAHSLPAAAHRRLVIDIGGGSTEIIIGTGFEPQLTESLYMGCLSYSLKFFADGKIDKPRMKAAELAARQELAGIVHGYRAAGWDDAVGSSGTARSMENILRENGRAHGWTPRTRLYRMPASALQQRSRSPARIAGLRPNRAPVLPGGLAIMGAALDELGIEAMKVSEGALRHGVLYDLLGRVQHRDMREATVTQFVRRYHIDAAQAERVRSLSLKIYDALAPGAERDEDVDRLVLEWAAKLAEIGLSIEDAQYHKHSAYVLSNADMPGFSRMEQVRLARVVLAHRGKLSEVQDAGLEGAGWKLVFALRTASLILRSRTDLKLPFLRVAADAGGFAIRPLQPLLHRDPASPAALESEADYWKAIGMKLIVRDRKSTRLNSSH